MQDALVKNAADEKQVKKADKKEKMIDSRNLEDMKFILQTVQGRRFIWRYLGLCGVFKSSFTGNSETFLNEGKRLVGLTLLNDINEADPDSYTRMMKEARSS